MDGYWGVNKHDTIYAGSNGKWKRIPGKLKQIAFSGSRVWGVNRQDNIFTRNGVGGNWQHVRGSLKQVSVSKNRVWGVNKNDDIFTRNWKRGGNWKRMPGKLKQIACSKNGERIWGVNRNDDIFTRYPVVGKWKRIPGKLKQIAVFGNTVWGVNRQDNIFTRPGAGGNWKHIPGRLKQIAVIGNTVWGMNKNNQVFTRPGVGGRWKHIKHQTVLPSLAGGQPSVKSSRPRVSRPRRHAACPGTFPYALQWKNSGSYWCYQRPDGNKGRGGVCRYLGSMRAPNRGKWGTNQKPCPQRDPRGGCYKDNTNGKRDLPVYKGRASQAGCAAMCKGFKYFGRQWTSECRCGNSYGKQGKATGCNCSGSNIGGNKNCVYAVPKPKPVKKTCHTSGINGFSDYAWDPRGRYCYHVKFGSGVQQDWSRNKSRCKRGSFRSNVYIGRYSGNAHVYPNGDSRSCPGGKKRKVTVTVKQDPRVSSTSAKVTEPRTCEYALVITRKSCPRRL